LQILHLTGLLAGLATAAFVLSAIGTWLMRRLAPEIGLVDHPGDRKIHDASIPLGGGVAIFLGLWASIWAGVAAALVIGPSAAWLPAWVAALVPGVSVRLHRIGAIFVCSLILGTIGLIDDRRGVRGWIRLLAVAAMAATLVVLKQERITVFFENAWFTGLITVLWVTGITCAFMVLDNMDGLCGGVALIVSTMFLVVALQTQQFFLAAVFAVLTGSLAGFLVFNFPPASIFMGECGSVTIGFVLAVLSVDFTFYRPDTTPARNLFPIVVPLLILAVPIFDIVSVTWIRLSEGRSPFDADTKHFSHRLVSLGMSRRQAVLTIYLVTAAIGLGATVLYYASSAGALVVALVQAAAVFAIIVNLERAGLSKERPGPK